MVPFSSPTRTATWRRSAESATNSNGAGTIRSCSFLKCLEADDARLPELIRDETKAREWFILCDSSNVQISNWVQEEVAMI